MFGFLLDNDGSRSPPLEGRSRKSGFVDILVVEDGSLLALQEPPRSEAFDGLGVDLPRERASSSPSRSPPLEIRSLPSPFFPYVLAESRGMSDECRRLDENVDGLSSDSTLFTCDRVDLLKDCSGFR